MTIDSVAFVILCVSGPFIFMMFIAAFMYVYKTCTIQNQQHTVISINNNATNINPDEYLPKYTEHPIDIDDPPPAYQVDQLQAYQV